MMSALFAQRSLDRHYLKDINVRLYVSTCNPDKEDLTPEELNQFKSLKNQSQDFKSFLKASRPLPNLPLDVPVKFFTCDLLNLPLIGITICTSEIYSKI